MSDLLSDALTGGLAVSTVWVLVSIPLALLLGRIMRARESHEVHEN